VWRFFQLVIRGSMIRGGKAKKAKPGKPAIYLE